MIAVIFELIPKTKHQQQYFDIALQLKQEVEQIEGFVSIERYQSLTESGKYLSLSFWKNEEAIKQWRQNHLHKVAQKKGRSSLFKDYRLCVAHVARDYGLHDRAEVPV